MTIPKTALDITDFVPNYQGVALPRQTYFYDPASNVMYSMRTGTPRRLYGTGTDTAKDLVFILTSANPHRDRRQVLIPAAVLAARVKPREQVQTQLEFQQQAVTASNQQHRGWIIGNLRADGTLGFSDDPRAHPEEASVNAEIERLARATPGTTFVKLRIDGYVTAGSVNWS